MFRKSLLLFTLTALLIPAFPQDASAQRRAVRRPASRSVVVVSRPFYRPYYYRPYYWPSYYGFYGSWYWDAPYYGQWGPYPGYRYRYDYTGAAQLKVKPRETEVYIDGYFVGTVDDFDGWWQRLNVEPGEHDLELYLPGHKIFRQPVLFRPGATLKLEHIMQPLTPGEAEEPRPTPSGRVSRPAPTRDPYQDPRRRPAPGDRGERGEFGSLAIRVQPRDAQIIVDGEPWDAPEGGDRLVIDLAEGNHRVEIRKDGFRTYTANVRVQRGQTAVLNVSLTQQ